MSYGRLKTLGRVPSGRSSIPVVAQINPMITPDERRRLAAIAAKILRDDPGLARTSTFGVPLRSGLTEAPAILLGDQREIGLFGNRPTQFLEHRIALLASEGDFLAVERSSPTHEAYLAELLGIRDLNVIDLGSPAIGKALPVASRCRASGPVFGELVAVAKRAGRLQVIPHIGAGSAWVLAAEIAQEAGVPVTVAAPPPRLTRQVNDKIWFAHRIREVLGPGALPPTFSAFGPAAVAAKIARLARTSERVIIKTPDSAGSLGNVAIDASPLRRLDLRRIRHLVTTLLRGHGWTGAFPLVVGVWEVDAVASPSVQLWVPAAGHGLPVIEGIFEQRLAGVEAEFVGALPASLPAAMTERMAAEALRLAILLQDLGYFGRCSLDSLIVETEEGGPEIHWIECNGRWGGVSVPMTLMNRLFGDHGRRGFVIVQDEAMPLAVRGHEAVHDRLGSLLFRRGDQQGVIPLSAHWVERGIGVHLLSSAATQTEAEALAEEAIMRLRE